MQGMEDLLGNFSDEDAIGSHLEIQIEAAGLANMDVFSLSDPFALLEEQKGEEWTEIGALVMSHSYYHLHCGSKNFCL